MITAAEISVLGMTTKKYRNLTIGLIATGAILAGGVGVATADVTPSARVAQSGWDGVTREQAQIDFGKGWGTNAELTYPSRAKGPLPLVVFLHGSGHNDMNQTLPDGKGATFVPLAQAASREGYATLRFNKRGVTGIGPVETTDPGQLNPKNPYDQI